MAETHDPANRFEVSCTMVGCYLRNIPMRYADPSTAELLAYAPAQRWKDDPETFNHTVVVKDLNEVQPSKKANEAATGNGVNHG